MAKEKVLEWASYQCGILYEKEYLNKGIEIDEAY